MNNLRWLNPTQPQTLYSAVMLAYFRGASIVLFGSVYYRQLAYDLLGLFASRVFPLLLLVALIGGCLLYTSPSPRDLSTSRMPSSA